MLCSMLEWIHDIGLKGLARPAARLGRGSRAHINRHTPLNTDENAQHLKHSLTNSHTHTYTQQAIDHSNLNSAYTYNIIIQTAVTDHQIELLTFEDERVYIAYFQPAQPVNHSKTIIISLKWLTIFPINWLVIDIHTHTHYLALLQILNTEIVSSLAAVHTTTLVHH